MSILPNVVNWYGGKHRLARQIISIFPEHEHYVEVFFGGGAVFFQKPKSPRNTINDINRNLVNLYIQIRDHFDELTEKVYWTLYSRQEYQKWSKELRNNDLRDISDIDRALFYLLIIKTSFSGMVGTGFSASIESNSATFKLDLIHRMKVAREKLDGVVIENRPFQDIVSKYGKEKGCLLYLDPPYYVTLKQSMYYEKTFSKDQHEYLWLLLKKCESPWVLSYDEVHEIVDMYKEFKQMRVSAIYSYGAKKKSRQVNELLIVNFKSKLPQMDIFDENNIMTEEITDEEKLNAENELKLFHEKQLESQPKKELNAISERNGDQYEQQGFFD